MSDSAVDFWLQVGGGGPKARTSDPETSHAAADAIVIKAKTQKGQLLLAHYSFRMAAGWGSFAGLTDEEAARRAAISLQSEYATRCSEHRNIGLIEETTETRAGEAGVERLVSRLTELGRAYVEEKFRS